MKNMNRTKVKKSKDERGYIHVYTGNGKGKTSAALGLAFRAMGNGMRSYIAQFMKGQHYSELRAADMVSSYITIEQFGRDTFLHISEVRSDDDVKMARTGLKKAEKEMLSGKYKIIILDEVIVANYYNLLPTHDIIKFMQAKPYAVELILTGRYAAEEIIRAADLVSEIMEIKHYFQQGVLARDGIER